MMQQPAPGPMAQPQPPSMVPQAQPQYGYQQQPPYPTMMMPQPPQTQGAAHPMWAQQQPPAQPQQTQSGQPEGGDEIRTLWIGDLQYWMDENYLLSCFPQTGEVVSVKVIRNKQTGQIEGYGFIEFVSRAVAERILQTYNATPMPNGEQLFRLNWATFSSGEKRDETPDYTVFVGDLAADVTDYMLQETFRARYTSVKGAKVVIDRLTGRTKGYGFVKFADESEQLRAMTEMNGAFCSTRPMRIGPATNKKTASGQKDSYQTPQVQGGQSDNDPNNTTIFVGGLDSSVTDDILRSVFSQYGALLHVKIPAGKRCGFVQFAEKHCAEEALRMLNGIQLGGQNVRLSWGRSPSNKQPQADPNQWSYGGYPQPQGHDYYGYAAQDPNMFYGGYPGYGNYQQPQQQPPPQPQQQQQQPQQMGFSY